MEKFAKLSSKVAEYDSNAKIFASKHLLIAILQTHGKYGRTTSSMFYVYLKVTLRQQLNHSRFLFSRKNIMIFMIYEKFNFH